MTDPAVEATNRALLKRGAGVELRVSDMEDAAREALKPIRELHQPHYVRWRSPYDDRYLPAVKSCEECQADWPCETAKLIYREDEL